MPHANPLPDSPFVLQSNTIPVLTPANHTKPQHIHPFAFPTKKVGSPNPRFQKLQKTLALVWP